jgi:hypothetical protein
MKSATLLLALAATACSSVRVSTDWDQNADLAALRTYAWMQPAEGAPDPFGGNTIVRNRVQHAIQRELAAKSVTERAESPDFYIALHGYSRERIDVNTWPSWGYGWRGGYSSHVDVYQWTEGTLVVDFVSASTRELLWRGVATAVMDSSSGSEERVDEAAKKLFEGFPPPPRAK